MSDRTISSTTGTEPENRGGWHQPSDRSAWQKPKETMAPEGWRVPALPTDLEEKPSSEGEWHLPRPEDTIFDPDSEIEVQQRDEELSPEDMIAELVKGAEEEVEEDEFFSMSELVALANLQTDGATSEEDAVDVENLSPAERAALQLSGDDVPSTVGEESAADYARRMAQQLASGDTPVPQETEPLAVGVDELAVKFRNTEQQVRGLRTQFQQGVITQDDLQARLRELMVLDNNNVWWMMGVETDTWYKYENGQWVQDIPPVTRSSIGGSPPTQTSQLNPDEVIAGSLPYLPSSGDAGAPAQSGLPRQVPVFDPNQTVVGSSAFDNTLPGSEPTYRNLQRVGGEPTIPIRRVTTTTTETVESPYGGTDAPSYDLDTSAPTYERYAEQERRSTWRMAGLAALVLLGCGLISAIAGVLAVVGWYNGTVGEFRDEIAALASYQPEFQTARILDANGNLIVELNSQQGGARTQVPLNQISPFMVHAIVSQENERFYDDPGFDPIAIGRAFLQNISSGTIESGASTITQQIARNFVLNDVEITPQRKITEILVAQEIANQYDKNFLLELYLNEIFFGNQSYGIEAASQFYFNKSASALNMAESALLASIVPAPANNDPVVNRGQAMINMKDTIDQMIDVGCLQFQHADWVQRGPFCVGPGVTVVFNDSEEQLLRLDDSGNVIGGVLLVQEAEVISREYSPRRTRFKYPHFVNYVQGQVEAMFGTDAMFQRGFTIYTTLNPRVQDAAEATLQQQVQVLRQQGTNVTTGAVLVADPRTGAITALVGSPDFTDESIDGQVDNTRTWQQPGSSIKPVVYAAALEGTPNGYLTPSSILWDVPSFYANLNYNPINFDRRFHGPTPVRFALQNSYNVAAVKAYEFIGNEAFQNMAERLGLNFLDETIFGLPSALGANEVRLIDMVEAYGTIANNGQHNDLYAINRITEIMDEQEVDVVMEPRPEPVQVISPTLAFLVTDILSDDQARAEQFGLNSNLTLTRLGIPTRDYVAAKTGTSNDSRDLWTMGYTNNAVVGVWLGRPDNGATFGTTGFTAGAPVWNRVMEAALPTSPQVFPNPGAVARTVCQTTGTLADDTCINRVSERFVDGQFPPPPDQGFVQTLNVDSWTGLIANDLCPDNVVARTYANIGDPFAVDWINNTGEGQSYAQALGIALPFLPAPTEECQSGVIPTIQLSSPAQNQVLTGEITITGQVAASNLASYQLAFAPASNPTNFVEIVRSSSQAQNPNSPLGSWDTSNIPNDNYILRLQAQSTSGGFIDRTVVVTTQNIPPTPTATPIPTLIPLPTLPPAGSFTPLPFDPVNPTPTATLMP